MKIDGYQYSLDFYKTDKTRIGQLPVVPDWEPAIEWTVMKAIREGKIPPIMVRDRISVRPVWHARLGEPYAEGFEVVIRGENGEETFSGRIPVIYLEGQAQRASYYFVESGLLEEESLFFYMVAAFPHSEDGDESKESGTGETGKMDKCEGMKHREIITPLPVHEATFQSLLNNSRLIGQENREDMPVFIPQSVLNEAIDLTKRAGTAETGGFLIGRLCCEKDSTEIAAVVTAQIPAEHSESQVTKLTFTHETWAALSNAVKLRDKQEILLGWWHSHSFMKESREKKIKPSAPNSQNKKPKSSVVFMSIDDCALHRTIFPRAYNTALVIGEDSEEKIDYQLYGWRYGMIKPRHFHLMNGEMNGEMKMDDRNRVSPKKQEAAS